MSEHCQGFTLGYYCSGQYYNSVTKVYDSCTSGNWLPARKMAHCNRGMFLDEHIRPACYDCRKLADRTPGLSKLTVISLD